MTSWLAKLEKQRDHLQRELSDVEHTGLSLVDDDMGVANCIDWDGCRVLMDGKPLEAAYDPDRRWGETWLAKELHGVHPVEAVCVDGAGNMSQPFRATVSL